ncbi:uncharacterized protein C1orf198 homolog isoform X2 [Petromyzon marinus]|uniref:Uncharacterized protein C1orf198 homolog isoform X2 n=1 Tax=Petromyzon marinus TaxID=7757 RepID=A0AAJ7X2A9_PETMA|nr:uncharacterized protein C1orf198 homolog isoform X2 [Petromyzon marinus]
MEEKAAVYFASLNPMARKIVAEIEKVRESHGPAWERLAEAQREAAIDAALIRAEARARYETRLHLLGARPASPSSSSPTALASCYPKLLIQPGQKTVHFGEDDIKWQDEHSAPFSWETKSQLEFSLSDLEPGSSSQPRPDSSLGHAGAATSAAATANGTATPAGGRAGKGQAGGREAHVVNTGPFPGVLRRVEEAGADETAAGPAAAPWKLSAERGKPAGAAAATAGTGPGSGAALTPAERLSSPYRRHDSASRSYDPRAGPAASRSGDPPPVARKPPPPSPGASYSSMADTAHRAFVSEPDESVFAPLSSSSSPPSSSSFPPPAAPAAVPWMLERAAASRPAPSVARTPPPVASAITVATPLLPASADKDELFTSPVGHSQSPGTSGVPIKSGFDFLDNW